MTRLFAGTPFDRPPVCDRCGKLESECVCPTPEPEGVPPHCQSVTIAVEKRKKGKTVTVLRGLSTVGNGSLELLTQLKSACGRRHVQGRSARDPRRARRSHPRNTFSHRLSHTKLAVARALPKKGQTPAPIRLTAGLHIRLGVSPLFSAKFVARERMMSIECLGKEGCHPSRIDGRLAVSAIHEFRQSQRPGMMGSSPDSTIRPASLGWANMRTRFT